MKVLLSYRMVLMLFAMVTTVASAGVNVRTCHGADGAYANPWQPGDLFINMNDVTVNAARADANGFETSSPSNAVAFLTKGDFRAGHVAMQDPNALSDLFVTASGENGNAGTLYHVARDTGTITPLNTALNANPAIFSAGLASDGSLLYIHDGEGNIDTYDFTGVKQTEDLVTGLIGGGFGGINQIAYDRGFLYIATGGPVVQVAPATGGVAATLAGAAGSEIPGIWVGGGRLFTADSGSSSLGIVGSVVAYTLDLSGPLPVVTDPVIEGTESGPGGFLGGVTVDIATRKIFAGSAGSFGAMFPGGVLAFDWDGDVEDHNEAESFLDVVNGLPNGGAVNVFHVPNPLTAGDMDCDGDVDFDDIDDFVLGLNNPAAYFSQFGITAATKGDTDADGDQDFDDISGFVAALSGEARVGSVPEPTTLALLGVALAFGLYRTRKRLRVRERIT